MFWFITVIYDFSNLFQWHGVIFWFLNVNPISGFNHHLLWQMKKRRPTNQKEATLLLKIVIKYLICECIHVLESIYTYWRCHFSSVVTLWCNNPTSKGDTRCLWFNEFAGVVVCLLLCFNKSILNNWSLYYVSSSASKYVAG